MSSPEPETTSKLAGNQDGAAHSLWALHRSNIIIAFATVLAVVTVLSVWTRTQVLETDEWVSLSTQVLEQPEVQQAVSTYLVEQLYADGTVATGIEQILPGNLSRLAGLLAGAIRGPITDGVENLLASERFQSLWELVNRRAHETLVSVLRGEDVGPVGTAEGEVALELRPLVVAVGENLGLRQDRLDAIPPEAGRIVIFESEELAEIQGTVATLEFLAWFLFVLVIAMYAVAVYIGGERRNAALRNVGLSLILVGFVILAVQAIAVRSLLDAFVDPARRPVADVVASVGTTLLREQAWSAVIYGLLIAGFAALRGDHRYAVETRRALAPALNASIGALAGGIVVFLLVMIWWSPGRAFARLETSLVLIALVVAAIATLRAQTQREFPNARFEDVFDRFRERA